MVEGNGSPEVEKKGRLDQLQEAIEARERKLRLGVERLKKREGQKRRNEDPSSGDKASIRKLTAKAGALAKENLNLLLLILREPTAEDFRLYRSILSARGVLVDRDAFLGGFLPRLQAALVACYGDAIGSKRIRKFFSEISLDKIFVIESNAYCKVIDAWRGGKVSDSRSLGYREASEGGLHPVSGAIFLKEVSDSFAKDKDFDFSVSVAEEVIHLFLDTSRGNLKSKLHRIIRKEGSIGSYDEYLSSPREQIAKAMVVGAFRFIYPDSDPRDLFGKDYRKSALMGERRIAELGWPNILAGRYTTNHEANFQPTA